MVDAALAGFDAGEVITIPSLPDAADWQAFENARDKLGPNLSLREALQLPPTSCGGEDADEIFPQLGVR